MPADNTTRVLLAVACAGVILRLAFAFGYWTGEVMTRDEREYLSLSRSVAAGDGFVYDAIVANGPVDPFGRAPGYPVFLALVGGGRAVTDSVPGSVKAAQAVLKASDSDTVTEAEIRKAVQDVTDKEPNPEEIHQVASRLASVGWPLAAAS